MQQQRPKFLDFDEKALTDWRGSPVSSALLEWFAWEADQANYSCAALLRKGEDRKATAMAGKAECWEEIMRQCMRQDPPKPEQDEAFVDPAFRFSPELAPKIEGGNEDVGTE